MCVLEVVMSVFRCFRKGFCTQPGLWHRQGPIPGDDWGFCLQGEELSGTAGGKGSNCQEENGPPN